MNQSLKENHIHFSIHKLMNESYIMFKANESHFLLLEIWLNQKKAPFFLQFFLINHTG